MVPRNEPQHHQQIRPWLPRQLSSSYPSLISPTSSVEGDDERSIGDEDDYFDTAPINRYTQHPMAVPAHDEEDTRPTSQKELAGWYCYGWASECFATCAMASFLPVTLEQLARDRGVLLSDRKTPCLNKWPPPDHGLSLLSRPKELPACIVKIGHLEINTASFAMYTFSISVLIQSLLIVSMSGAADHGRFRKILLLTFAFAGALALMLFLVVTPNVYLLGALLAIVSNTCFGASFVLLNSFLPVLVRHHPSVLRHNSVDHERAPLLQDNEYERRLYSSNEDLESSRGRLIPQDSPDHTTALPPAPSLVSEELKLSTKISSYGIGIGYIAGLMVQVSAIFIVVATKQTTFSLRLVLFVVGVWWFVFTIPSALWLRPRPGPPLPASVSGHSNWFGYIAYAWGALFKTIRRARRLKDIVIFLGAWFLLSDGIATVSGTAVLFAKTNLAMDTSHLALISVIGTLAGVVGAFYWSTFSRFLGLRASQTIMACVCIFELIPLYGLLGFIPAIKRLGFLGLQQPIEIYFLGAVYGFVLGGISSYCRAFFGELIPPGFEASFYALYAITDKGSSIFGPAIVGAITDRYGDIRPAFVFLAILIFLPLPLLMLVDPERGKADAAAMALELEGKASGNEAGSARVTTSVLTEDEETL